MSSEQKQDLRDLREKNDLAPSQRALVRMLMPLTERGPEPEASTSRTFAPDLELCVRFLEIMASSACKMDEPRTWLNLLVAVMAILAGHGSSYRLRERSRCWKEKIVVVVATALGVDLTDWQRAMVCEVGSILRKIREWKCQVGTRLLANVIWSAQTLWDHAEEFLGLQFRHHCGASLYYTRDAMACHTFTGMWFEGRWGDVIRFELNYRDAATQVGCSPTNKRLQHEDNVLFCLDPTTPEDAFRRAGAYRNGDFPKKHLPLATSGGVVYTESTIESLMALIPTTDHGAPTSCLHYHEMWGNLCSSK